MSDERSIDTPGGPSGLLELPDPPDRVWVRGRVPDRPCVAIVGTRRADPAACAFAHRLAGDLARAGFGVVSGGADGIDASAHEGALAAGGATWVVLPTPIDRPYPRHHRFLFERALSGGGGWLSERPPGEPSARHHFLQRNRIIAAIAEATVVVQAPHKSGALSTARWARKLGRPLLAVPASPWDPRSAGGVRLLRDGALPCLSAREVTRVLGHAAPPPAPARPLPRLGPEQRAVLDALGPRPAAVDEIARATGLRVARVRVALVELAAFELAGRRGGGWLAVA